MDNRKPERIDTTRDAIVRLRDMVEDAPYTLDSGKITEVRLTASCGDDDINPMRLKRPDLKNEK